MASITSLSSGGSNSLYGNRNVLSGLASGMDTESMIQNAISGYQTKIDNLQKKSTAYQWQQEAYRSVIDKLVAFNQKYTSYTSATNLSSPTFFNKAVSTTTGGANAGKVSATGRTNSDILINGIKQLATASRYEMSADGLGGTGVITGGKALDLDKSMELSKMSGTMTLGYGGTKSVTLTFDETDIYKSPKDLAQGIREKLKGQNITLSTGEVVSADTRIGVFADDSGGIYFTDVSEAKNDVSITGASGALKDTLGIDPASKASSFSVTGDLYDSDSAVGDYLSGKTVEVTLDGTTKKITLPGFEKGVTTAEDYKNALNTELTAKFGKGKVTAGLDGEGKLTFQPRDGSTLSVTSRYNAQLGLSSDQESSYLNTGKTLGSLLSDFKDKGTLTQAVGEVQYSEDNDIYYDSTSHLVTEVKYDEEAGMWKDRNGNEVKGIAADADTSKSQWLQSNSKGEVLYTQELKVNGVTVGKFHQDTALESVLVAINSNSEAGISGNYSKLTNSFVFTTRETGEGGNIEFGDGLAQRLFGSTYQLDGDGNILTDADGNKLHAAEFSAGQDAIFSASVNGGAVQEYIRSSNTTNMDGMNVTLQGAFGYTDAGLDPAAEAVTFTSKADSDTLVTTIKDFVKDYNEMVKAIRDAYNTAPNYNTSKQRYDPLTDAQAADMTETAIKNYETKAKAGLLYADSDLSSLYSRLNDAVNASGADGNYLRSIGIKTSYSSGLTTLELDEDAFRDALERDPEGVRDAFTKSKAGGSETDGLMANLKTQLDNYASTTGSVKGILIQKAGSVYAPTSIRENTLQERVDELAEQISTWQARMSDKVDYYTSQFTQMEQLISQMNNQSSMLSGMMGG